MNSGFMPLTDEQQKKIAEILERYGHEADRIVAEHHEKVKQVLADLDKKKIEEIEKMIGQ